MMAFFVALGLVLLLGGALAVAVVFNSTMAEKDARWAVVGIGASCSLAGSVILGLCGFVWAWQWLIGA